jgi:hypothetical protein
METKVGKARLVWGLYGVLAVGILQSAVSVKPARAVDFDPCTQSECDAGYTAAYLDCQARGGLLDYYTCPRSPAANFQYAYGCSINGVLYAGNFGYCD